MRNADYIGDEPDELYVIWSDGKWRFYASLGQAQRFYLRVINEGKTAKFVRYSDKSYIGKASNTI